MLALTRTLQYQLLTYSLVVPTLYIVVGHVCWPYKVCNFYTPLGIDVKHILLPTPCEADQYDHEHNIDWSKNNIEWLHDHSICLKLKPVRMGLDSLVTTRLQALSSLPCYALGILFRVQWAISPYRTMGQRCWFCSLPPSGAIEAPGHISALKPFGCKLGAKQKSLRGEADH